MKGFWKNAFATFVLTSCCTGLVARSHVVELPVEIIYVTCANNTAGTACSDATKSKQCKDPITGNIGICWWDTSIPGCDCP